MNRILGFFAIFLLLSSSAMTAPSCPTVISKLMPCVSYITGQSTEPSKTCCAGAKDINNMAKAKSDRVAVCNCIKLASSGAGYFDPSRISLLPKKCGLSINLPPIDKNFDCSKISFKGAVPVAG